MPLAALMRVGRPLAAWLLYVLSKHIMLSPPQGTDAVLRTTVTSSSRLTQGQVPVGKLEAGTLIRDLHKPHIASLS